MWGLRRSTGERKAGFATRFCVVHKNGGKEGREAPCMCQLRAGDETEDLEDGRVKITDLIPWPVWPVGFQEEPQGLGVEQRAG